jgi:hypothetical protein
VSDSITEIVHTFILDTGMLIRDLILIECLTDTKKATDWIMVTINTDHIRMAQ